MPSRLAWSSRFRKGVAAALIVQLLSGRPFLPPRRLMVAIQFSSLPGVIFWSGVIFLPGTRPRVARARRYPYGQRS